MTPREQNALMLAALQAVRDWRQKEYLDNTVEPYASIVKVLKLIEENQQ